VNFTGHERALGWQAAMISIPERPQEYTARKIKHQTKTDTYEITPLLLWYRGRNTNYAPGGCAGILRLVPPFI
jgi:hypothetical protein